MKIIQKGQKLYSIIHFKCPHCHEGDFFEDNNPYHFKSMGHLKKSCEVCGNKFSMETGFYYGAMYVAYALGVAHSVTIWVAAAILNILPHWKTMIWIIAATLVVFSPLYYVLSKIIWANLFIKYKKFSKS